MKFISFLSDFGESQEYVGVCKAVILSLCPTCVIVDISHSVPSYDIREGAFMLKNFVKYAPAGVHMAVIDPGVGTERRGILIETERGDILVGPDNGVLMNAAAFLGFKKAVALENKKYMLENVSSSFHGRDVFAPAAAYCAQGVSLTEFGKTLDKEELIELREKQAKENERAIHTHVTRIDRFGNVQLCVAAENVKPFITDVLPIEIEDEKLMLPFVKTFGEVADGELLVYEDSDGLLTLAQNQGNAAQLLNIEKDTTIVLLKRNQ